MCIRWPLQSDVMSNRFPWISNPSKQRAPRYRSQIVLSRSSTSSSVRINNRSRLFLERYSASFHRFYRRDKREKGVIKKKCAKDRDSHCEIVVPVPRMSAALRGGGVSYDTRKECTCMITSIQTFRVVKLRMNLLHSRFPAAGGTNLRRTDFFRCTGCVRVCGSIYWRGKRLLNIRRGTFIFTSSIII